jgi:hypothetical protein
VLFSLFYFNFLVPCGDIENNDTASALYFTHENLKTSFPEYSGESIVYRIPVDFHNGDLRPVMNHHMPTVIMKYGKMISEICKKMNPSDVKNFLEYPYIVVTIRESYAQRGSPQFKTAGIWHRYSDAKGFRDDSGILYDGVFIANSIDNTCTISLCNENGDDCDERSKVSLKGNQWYWITGRTWHKTEPMPESGNRQFISVQLIGPREHSEDYFLAIEEKWFNRRSRRRGNKKSLN